MNGFAFQTDRRFAEAFSPRGPEDEILATATELARLDYLSPPFFAVLQRSAEVVLLELWHGSWEVYPAETSLVDAVASNGTRVTEVSSARRRRRGME